MWLKETYISAMLCPVAVSSPVKPLVSGVFTQRVVLQIVKDLMLSEFEGLEPFGVLEYRIQ